MSEMTSQAPVQRKLVTVRRVGAIRPIQGADAIECASVEGWDVVIKKGEFSPGDTCIYFEIDSFLPANDERYAFLAKNKITWSGREGIRLRTVKLRGQISQGLILPVELFPELHSSIAQAGGQAREIDLSSALGVQKWEAPIPTDLAGEVEGPFPDFIRKTDQERIQNLPSALDDVESKYEVTVKLDGSSMTVFHRAGVVGVCGRNWWLKASEQNALWQVARRDKLVEALTSLGRNLALQGEIVGPGIQGNAEQLQQKEFHVFDVFDIDTQAYVGRDARAEILRDLVGRGAGLRAVPEIEVTSLARFAGDLSAVLSYAEGPSLNPKTSREGIVFKRLDGGFSFKAISNSYLLKYGDR